jgi:transposase
MPTGLVTMSSREIDRGELIRRVRAKALKQRKAAELMGISVRQVKRMCRRFKDAGLAGLASRKRGRPSNRKLSTAVKAHVVALVRERYADFGPKLAHEKLVEVQGITVATTGRDQGVTQFGRVLAELNIDIICANSPQAKGRVERMNSTLQDRLVKELRLRAISTMETGNTFLPEFMEDFNRRFAKPPRNPHDAHRPVDEQAVGDVLAWREERTMSRNLVVHYKRVSYLIDPTNEALRLGSRRVSVHEWQDGRVEIRCGSLTLPTPPSRRILTSALVTSSRTRGWEPCWLRSRQLRPNATRPGLPPRR